MEPGNLKWTYKECVVKKETSCKSFWNYKICRQPYIVDVPISRSCNFKNFYLNCTIMKKNHMSHSLVVIPSGKFLNVLKYGDGSLNLPQTPVFSCENNSECIPDQNPRSIFSIFSQTWRKLCGFFCLWAWWYGSHPHSVSVGEQLSAALFWMLEVPTLVNEISVMELLGLFKAVIYSAGNTIASWIIHFGRRDCKILKQNKQNAQMQDYVDQF